MRKVSHEPEYVRCELQTDLFDMATWCCIVPRQRSQGTA